MNQKEVLSQRVSSGTGDVLAKIAAALTLKRGKHCPIGRALEEAIREKAKKEKVS